MPIHSTQELLELEITMNRFVTFKFWRDWWFYWLLAVALSWLGMELLSMYLGRIVHVPNTDEWTLSDTIRDWASTHSWLAPLAIGVMCMLMFRSKESRGAAQTHMERLKPRSPCGD